MSAQKKHMERGLHRPSIALAVALFATCSAHAVDIERPPVQFVDKFGVNMANGQVTHSLTTLSIGGAMGLSHSVSVFANEFNFIGMRGFADKFYARAQNVQLCSSSTACDPMNVMRVEDGGGSHSFAYGLGTGYVSIGDERHTLEVSGSEFLWTKPDGTVVHFNRYGASLPANAGGTLSQIDYPNGFRIWVSQGSVNTNTGFQLKYYFNWTNPPLDKTEPSGLQAPIVSPSWPLHNPKYIRGINASKVFCDWTTAPCSAGDEWPTAQFDWPAGMPRTMYIGDSIVKVTDSAKRATTYKFRAYDLAYDRLGVVIPPYVPGREFSPRLKEIIPPGASATKFSYDYDNLFVPNMWRMDYRLQSAGVVKSAVRAGGGPDATNTYDINQPFMSGDTQNTAGANGGISQVVQQNYYGNPSGTYYLHTADGQVWFETTGRGFPDRFEKYAAPVEHYFYETRSNLTKVTYNDPNGAGYQIVAEYPASCTNRKTCNQATRIRDAKGNWTDYTYHPDSGQVASITYPANKEGIRAQTRFTYGLRYATYYNSAGNKVQSSDGIWMKTAEEYCISSTASAGNCEAANDEVVTTYEYDHPNLLMTGMLVTSPDGTRRTCYRYDKFGNQIGVTTPNANLPSCPGETP